MADHADTIAAVATPAGRGGVAVVRLSGKRCRAIAESLTGLRPEPRYAHYTAFLDGDGEVIDRGLLLYFPGPASYTGEDVLELHGHAGRSLPRMLLARAVELGARYAEPGEFTQRAFLNDKLDLIQAEAVADLIDSGSERAARSAMRSLEGEFSRRIEAIVGDLIEVRVNVESALDFPDEELELMQDADLPRRLDDCLETLQALVDSADRGRLLREGLRVVILGRPNVGKSSLLNRLGRSERAIVTDVPGTTRDLIEDQILLDGLTVNVVDTAGLRESRDAIEREGMQRALAAAASADAVIVIHDTGAGGKPDLPEAELAGLENVREVIIVRNKIDLAGEPPSATVDAAGRTVIALSARTGAGVERLVSRLQESGAGDDGGDVILARDRHVEALHRAAALLRRARRRLEEHAGPELLAEDLRNTQSVLGEITGEVTPDDLLGEIFARFCIGK